MFELALLAAAAMAGALIGALLAVAATGKAGAPGCDALTNALPGPNAVLGALAGA